MKHYFYYLLFLVASNSSFLKALTTWEHSFAFNVTDDDIRWRKKITLPVGTTTIQAANQDITITLHHDVTIHANESGPSTLIFNAQAGRTIRVLIDEKLEFKTSTINENDLIIELAGEGTIDFDIIPTDH